MVSGLTVPILDAPQDRLCDESKSIGNGSNHTNIPLLGCFQLAESQRRIAVRSTWFSLEKTDG